MQFSKLSAAAAVVLSAGVLITGCSATSESQAVDNRPRISFQTKMDASLMNVWVDGIAYGKVSSYRANKAALQVLPGTHTVTVSLPNGQKVVQKVYVADGVTKIIRVP
jgi:uncharacterized lipoprotein YajG